MINRLIFSIALIVVLFWLEGVFPHFKGRKHRLRHAFPNIILASMNGIISSLLFAGLILFVIHFSEKNSFGIVRILDVPLFAKGIIAFLLFDFWMYLWHRANHEIPFLWRFHRVHHNDIEMDTTTALRFHPMEMIFSSMLRLVVIPLIGIDVFVLVIYEMCLQLVVFFHHSNIGLQERWDRLIRLCIVTPNMHRVHHSKERDETDSNYSTIFSFWDRILHTFKKSENTLSITLGLKKFREYKWHQLKGMLILPFK
ncbi:sterol desaturase family protein [Candidatus Omnitrophota bacterium]